MKRCFLCLRVVDESGDAYDQYNNPCPLCKAVKARDATTTKQDPYAVTIGNVRADPYRIARAYGITDPIIFQVLKKLLRSGRKHKSLSEDVAEAITSLQRWQEMEKEDKE